ncbi:hypothetical protein AGMMS49975_02610 [Clostridia bacterium]|nr:hypothetical protein AGMMS49975_02610 [Clostridia bacterium]
MDDVYKEQLVRKYPTTGDKILKLTLCVVGAVVETAVFLFSAKIYQNILLPVIVLFGIYFGLRKLFSFLDIEYEYSYTNGELDIDCIYAKNNRRRVFSGNVSGFEFMAHISEKKEFKFDAEKNYGSGKITDNTYYFFCVYNNVRTKIIFEPNATFINLFKSVLPRKFFDKK